MSIQEGTAILTVNLFHVLIGDLCDGNTCSGHGSCSNGKCTCERLYKGNICQYKGG